MAKRANSKDSEDEVHDLIAAMTETDRALAEPLDALIRASAPGLTPKRWYGQPAYAKSGKVVVFFRAADHDGERYFTLGFTKHAELDDGGLWPTAFAVTELGESEVDRIARLIKKALG